MALIKCPECGRDVSQFANTCPHCGCPAPISLKTGPIRYDGKYDYIDYGGSPKDASWISVRFYPDGTAIKGSGIDGYPHPDVFFTYRVKNEQVMVKKNPRATISEDEIACELYECCYRISYDKLSIFDTKEHLTLDFIQDKA